jgi:hypothetical protein
MHDLTCEEHVDLSRGHRNPPELKQSRTLGTGQCSSPLDVLPYGECAFGTAPFDARVQIRLIYVQAPHRLYERSRSRPPEWGAVYGAAPLVSRFPSNY